MLRRFKWTVLPLVWCVVQATTACAYVDRSATLGTILRESETITVAEVERFSLDKGAVLLKKVRDLKGKTDDGPIRHQLIRTKETCLDRPILAWAEPGRRCVVFVTGKTGIVCIGEGWYQISAGEDDWWRMGPHRPDLPLAYYGTVSRLADAIPTILAGRSATITTMPHGADAEGASFDLALNRANLPGLARVQRIRASLRMPGRAMGVGVNSMIVLGLGRAGVEDIPALRESLRAANPTIRAEGAADLGSLGPAAAEAAGQLAELLADQIPAVRMNVAAALLRIKPKETRPVEVLADGLACNELSTRWAAVRAVGLAGAASAPLVGKLGALLKDSDVRVRRAALEALATLGPAAAAATPAVTALLDDPDSAIDAADALGRIGPLARPALKSLARLLSADSPARRWAAVRAMAQIGGPGAAPAVQFMIREMPQASEIDNYNMMIYLALLGPVAKDAIPAIQRSRLMNPFLRQTTVWAIEPGTELPWLTPMGNSSVAQLVLESYVHELGDQLKPLAQTLAKKILSGDAGDVPPWGYKLLAKYPEEPLKLLTPPLSDSNRTMRERAAVALGYMGRAARAVKPQVAEALNTAKDEKEQLLLKWCVREIERGHE